MCTRNIGALVRPSRSSRAALGATTGAGSISLRGSSTFAPATILSKSRETKSKVDTSAPASFNVASNTSSASAGSQRTALDPLMNSKASKWSLAASEKSPGVFVESMGTFVASLKSSKASFALPGASIDPTGASIDPPEASSSSTSWTIEGGKLSSETRVELKSSCSSTGAVS